MTRTTTESPDPEPSQTGIERFPPDGYHRNDDWLWPCTCKPECSWVCKGDCGCLACDAIYQDAMTLDYD